jgi:ABC-type nitrate/sulfonate/bicarbonate transport system substrate-binding protein
MISGTTLGRFIAKAALAITAISAFLPTQADAQQTIRVGYLAQVHDGPLLAAEKALGADYKLEYVKFLRYTDAEIALSNNDIQVSSLGYVSAISSANRGGEPKFKFVAGQSRGAINLVCRDDVTIADWADLKGKTFGVLTGGPAEVFFDQALGKHGIQLADVKKVSFPVPGPPLLQALKDKVIACTAVYEPFAASAVADGYGYYPPIDLADNPFLGINGGIAVTTGLLQSDKEFVRKLVDVVVKTADSYPKNKDEWVATVSAKTGFAPKTVALGADHVVLDWRLYPDRVNTLASAVAALGAIKQVPAPDSVSQYFDTSFLPASRGTSQ